MFPFDHPGKPTDLNRGGRLSMANTCLKGYEDILPGWLLFSNTDASVDYHRMCDLGAGIQSGVLPGPAGVQARALPVRRGF